MDRVLLERYVPASALIDRHVQRCTTLRGPIEDYLRPPSGEPSYNLISMARRRAAERCCAPRAQGDRKGPGGGGGRPGPAQPGVAPRAGQRGAACARAAATQGGCWSPFRARGQCRGGRAVAELDEAGSDGELQAELDATREDLRLTIEQMEAANEELKASNEEIHSINEELQASNEELETSKEELQSLNEELKTVNSQLQAKVDELEARTNDLNNLLNSTDIATLFLDRSLCIRWFTPSMKTLLELLPTDVGRPISHFAQRFTGGDLVEEARKVLERLVPAEAEVKA